MLKEQKRIGWAMAGILILTAIVLQEAHERQVEEVMDVLSEGPEGVYNHPY